MFPGFIRCCCCSCGKGFFLAGYGGIFTCFDSPYLAFVLLIMLPCVCNVASGIYVLFSFSFTIAKTLYAMLVLAFGMKSSIDHKKIKNKKLFLGVCISKEAYK